MSWELTTLGLGTEYVQLHLQQLQRSDPHPGAHRAGSRVGNVHGRFCKVQTLCVLGWVLQGLLGCAALGCPSLCAGFCFGFVFVSPLKAL